jgi:Putative transposase
MLAYLSRYTHRIAISNRRLVAWDDTGVTFKWNDYRLEGPDRYKTMTLAVGEFISPPDARAAEAVPSHSPLRSIRQWCARREYCRGRASC